MALKVARTQRFDAIVAHRSTDMDELSLVEHSRAATAAPIIMMSGSDHAKSAVGELLGALPR